MKRSLLRFFLILLSFFSGILSVNAQKRANNWVFSDTELHFDGDAAVRVSRPGTSYINRGMGVISDESGALLFYTDGVTVWNKNHEIMPNGWELTPDDDSPTVQNSLVVPKPGSNNVYYIFTANAWNGQASAGLYYAEVNMQLNGGLGGVTVKTVKLVDKTTNNITAVFHQNGKDVWVLVNQHASNKYFLVSVTDQGVSSTIKQQSLGPVQISWDGQLKFSPDGKFAAVSTEQEVGLFNFDDATGTLSDEKIFTFDDLGTSPWLQGLEFSSDARKVYVFENRYSSVFQFDLSSADFETIKASRYKHPQTVLYNLFNQFQLAPDGNIYVTKGGGGGGSESFGVISNANALRNNVTIEENGLYLEGGQSVSNRTPSFIQNYFFKTGFIYEAKCQGVAGRFKVTNDFRLDSVRWFFGDGRVSVAREPSIKYDVAGEYTVTLRAFYGEKAVDIKQKVVVAPYEEFDLGESFTTCPEVMISAPRDLVSYLWNNGDVVRSTTIAETGWYKVTVSNAHGCLSSDSVYVTVTSLPVIDFPDSVRFGEQLSADLDAGAFDEYEWNTGETTRGITVVNEGWYSVTVKNSDGCSAAKSVYVGNSEFTASPGWVRLNPRPTGNAGLDIIFIDPRRGFIVNENEILRTSDGGQTWKVQQQITSGARIAFKDRIGYTVGLYGTMYKSTHNGGGWNRMTFPYTENLNAISMVSKDTVRVTSSRSLYLTNDGGASWLKRSIPFDAIVKDVCFINSKVGHVACTNGKIMKTTDSGLTWRITQSVNSFPSDYFRITFVDEKVGYASRQHSDIYKTTDGGESWVEITATHSAAFGLFFLNEDVGFMTGEHGAMYKTTNGGNSWEALGFSGFYWGYDLYDIHFTDEDNGYATGLMGRILKTTNGGVTWSDYATTYYTIGQLEFPVKDIGYAIVGGTDIYKTTNSGKDWKKVSRPLEHQQIRQLKFFNNDVGYAIGGASDNSSGQSGMLLKTIDGGVTWKKTHAANEITSENLTTLYFIDENTGFVSGGFNWASVLKTVDGGKTWGVVYDRVFGGIQFVTNTTGFAFDRGFSTAKVYKTTNTGNTWQVIFETEDEIKSLYFINEATGFIVGDQGLVKTTHDGGATWTDVTNVPWNYYVDIRFVNGSLGYMLDEDGYILKTFNGGKTWRYDFSRFGLTSLEIVGTEIYAAGNFGSMFKYVLPQGTQSVSALQVFGVRPTDAWVSGVVKSSVSLQNAALFLEIGTQSKVYTSRFEVGTLSGILDQSVPYLLTSLDPTTRYYCQYVLESDLGQAFSEELSFRPVDLVTGVEESALAAGISIYPNPAAGTVHIEVSGRNVSHLPFSLSDVAGHVVFTGSVVPREGIDISLLKPGLYMVTIDVDGHQFTTRLMKR